MRRRLLLWTPILVLVILPFTGCLTLDRQFVYYPSRYPEGDWKPGGTEFEDVWFEAEDGTRLHGWFAEAKNPRAVVLHMHGNAGNITHRAELLRLFRDQLRVSIFLFDYRGYGRSEGSPDEKGILADARAARAWLAGRTGVAETGVVLHGTSLGGGVAVDLAADGARGLILENTFTSVPDVAAHRAPFLPVRRLLKTRLDSLARIGDYHGPLLQTHGDADSVIPFEQGQRLFEAANEPKQFLRVSGGDHNDAPTSEYVRALDRFLESLPGR
jgi:fermentation-respiration switch protein FrsA (DUF1100 family)